MIVVVVVGVVVVVVVSLLVGFTISDNECNRIMKESCGYNSNGCYRCCCCCC